LEEIQNFVGHTAFVFSVKSLGLGLYISGGDDRSVRVWKDNTCEQSIQLPASVWQLAFDNENHDIIVGCSDGFLRIFTQDAQRKAPQQEI
jgi:phospholipase A-2-activating protein